MMSNEERAALEALARRIQAEEPEALVKIVDVPVEGSGARNVYIEVQKKAVIRMIIRSGTQWEERKPLLQPWNE